MQQAFAGSGYVMQQAFVCSGYVMQQAFVCSGYVMQHTFIGLFSWITAMTIKITEERGKIKLFQEQKIFHFTRMPAVYSIRNI
jgi:hypothetical protein